MMTTTPLTDFSTISARADEVRRRKLRKVLAAQWAAVHAAIDSEKVADMRAVTDAQWQAAKDEDVSNAA